MQECCVCVLERGLMGKIKEGEKEPGEGSREVGLTEPQSGTQGVGKDTQV